MTAGPIKDDTGSKPYVQLNQIMDEEQAHGTHLYMCAANQVIYPSDCVMPIYEQFCNMIAETPEFQGSLVAFEFIPNDVVRSKPDDATAYNCRNFSNNALVIVKWKNNDDSGLREKARAYAKTITKLVDPGQGENQTPYGNYGTSPELMSGGGADCQSPTSSRAETRSRSCLGATTPGCRRSRPSTTRTWSSTSGSPSLRQPESACNCAQGSSCIGLAC